MNRISKQQIKVLEVRVARLEKEAKILEWLKSIPVNLLSKIKDSFKEVASVLKITFLKNKDKILDTIKTFLETRINTSLDKSLMAGYPIRFHVLDFDSKNPMNSEVQLVTQKIGEAKEYIETTMRNLPKEVEGKEGLPSNIDKDIKGAYASWWKDFENELRIVETGKVNRPQDLREFWVRIKGASKFLYRVLRMVYNFKWAYEVISLSALITAVLPFAQAREKGSNLTLLGIGKLILNILETSLRRRKVNLDLFDELAAKKASSSKYSHIHNLLTNYEAFCL